MLRRLLLALAGGVLYGLAGWHPPAESPRAGRPAVRSLLADDRLLAIERGNGCLEEPAPAPASQAWPDWATAHIAGGARPPPPRLPHPPPTPPHASPHTPHHP